MGTSALHLRRYPSIRILCTHRCSFVNENAPIYTSDPTRAVTTVILVLSKQFLSFTRVFHLKQRRPKTHTPTRHRRTTTVIRGSGIPVVRFMFWKEDTQARTPVPSPEAWRSRPARKTPVLNRAFHTTTRTGTPIQRQVVTGQTAGNGLIVLEERSETFVWRCRRHLTARSPA